MANKVTRSIIVKADTKKVYDIWKDFENFPYFMKHVKSVTKFDESTSRWEVNGPLGKDLKWDAEITRMEENKRIAWSTKDHEGGSVTTSGQVTFNDLPQGQTEVTVMFQYEPAGGISGDLIAKLFARPEEKLEEDLQNFKNFAEGNIDRYEEK